MNIGNKLKIYSSQDKSHKKSWKVTMRSVLSYSKYLSNFHSTENTGKTENANENTFFMRFIES